MAIILKNSIEAAKEPLATDLQIGELALNSADGKLFMKLNDNAIKEIGGSAGGGSGSPGGNDTEIQFNSAGAFAGDPGLTYLDGSLTVLTGSLVIGDVNTNDSANYTTRGINSTSPDFETMGAGGSPTYPTGGGLGYYAGWGDGDGDGGYIWFDSGGNSSGAGAGGNITFRTGLNGLNHPDDPGGNGTVEIMHPTFNVKFNKDLKINDDAGSVGQVLTSNGLGNPPSWQAGGGGGTAPFIPPRITTLTSAASIAPDASTTDQLNFTGLGQNININAPTGMVDGQRLIIRITGAGGGASLFWAAVYRAGSGLPLPTSALIGKTSYFVFMYNLTDNKWDFVSQSPDF